MLPIRTLLFSFYAAYPPTGGASAVTYQLARHWPGKRVLVQIGVTPGEHEPEPGLKIVTLRYPGRGERWQKLAEVPQWIRQMAAIATTEQPDMIVLEGASWTAYHWLLMMALRRRVPDAKLIYHAHNVEYDLRRQRHSKPVAELTHWFEGRLLAGADVATSVSAADASRFRALYGRDTIALPNGIDVAWLRSASSASVNVLRSRYGFSSETVLFMGGYGYRPNKEAIDFLVKDVFPYVTSARPQSRLLLLGGAVPYQRPWLIAPGLVPSEDLPSFIHAAAVSVAPIISGSGTRLKIIESLAAGIPVIATAKGVEGLPLKAGIDFMQAETSSAFVNALCQALAGPSGYKEKFLPSFDHIRREFDWSGLVRKFLDATASRDVTYAS